MWPPGSADTVCPRPPLTLTYGHLTLKLVCELRLRWGTFLPNLGMLGLCILELFAIDVCDGWIDRRTNTTLIAPSLWSGYNGDDDMIVCVSGLWPSFLQSGSDAGRRRVLDINLVDHFVSAQHDGSMITWAHATNSRERLKQALMSRRSCLAIGKMWGCAE